MGKGVDSTCGGCGWGGQRREMWRSRWLRWCIGGIGRFGWEIPAWAPETVSFEGAGPFASALVEAIKVSENLKAKDAIFWPLRLITWFVLKSSRFQ